MKVSGLLRSCVALLISAGAAAAASADMGTWEVRLRAVNLDPANNWLMIRSDVLFQGTKITQARLDPFLFGVGVGYRFNER